MAAVFEIVIVFSAAVSRAFPQLRFPFSVVFSDLDSIDPLCSGVHFEFHIPVVLRDCSVQRVLSCCVSWHGSTDTHNSEH